MGYNLRIFRGIKQEFSLGLSNRGKRGREKCSPFPHPLVFRFLPHPFHACHTQAIISNLYGPLTETTSVTVFLSSGIEIMIFARMRLQKCTSVNSHLLKTQAHLVRETKAGKRRFAFYFLAIIDSPQVSGRSFKL